MEYLLFLQGIRDNAPTLVNMIFVIVSEMILYIAPVIAIIMYLCFDKKRGMIIGFNLCIAVAINSILKLAACVYRPWITDSRIHLAKEASSSATGYSFPSGHTTAGTATYGSLAIWKKENKGFVTGMIIMILFTALARNYLGAHTLKDVVVAIAETGIVLFINLKVCKLLEEKPEIDVYILVGILLLCIGAAIYFLTKSYPMDYNAEGELMVDPVIMMKDGFSDIGMLSALVIGWFVERRFINFKVEGDKKTKILRGVMGTLVFLVFFAGIGNLFKLFLDIRLASFLKRFFSVLVTVGVYPYFIKRQQEKAAELSKI